jgi:hypothetical protein
MPPQCPTLYASAHTTILVGDLAQHGRGDETYVTVKLHIGRGTEPFIGTAARTAA